MALTIRPANRLDALRLTEIAHAAKRHWGYPEPWIASWRDELTVTPAYVAAHHVYVAVADADIVGSAALEEHAERWALGHFWIRPKWIGRGVGRRLFRHAVAEVQSVRPAPIYVESDPYAEGFYLRMGARRVGERPAQMDDTPRSLPCMLYEPPVLVKGTAP